MKKVAYGYADAPWGRFNVGDGALRELGMTPLEVHPATYVLRDTGQMAAGLCMQVECGTSARPEQEMDALGKYMQRLKVGKFRTDELACAGAQVAREENGDDKLSQN